MDGTAANETFTVQPIGGRARVAAGAEAVDLGDLERLDVLPARART